MEAFKIYIYIFFFKIITSTILLNNIIGYGRKLQKWGYLNKNMPTVLTVPKHYKYQSNWNPEL